MLLLMLRAEVGAEDLMEAVVVVAEAHLTVEAVEVCSCLLTREEVCCRWFNACLECLSCTAIQGPSFYVVDVSDLKQRL